MIRQLLPFIAVAPASIYSVMSLICGALYFRRERTRKSINTRSSYPSISIIKPLKGADAASYRNFTSFLTQNYAGEVQILFAVASPDDPVLEIVHTVKNDFPERDVSVVINPAIHGPNFKVSNLINAFPGAHHDIIIICDSDINVAPDYLSEVSAHFSDERVGLVTSLYRTSEVDGLAAALEASGFTIDMIPNVMVALQLEGLSFALGASMAVRRQALHDIGGFEALSDYLADDYQLGNKIHAAGWDIHLDSCYVESTIRGESLMAVLSRQLRWARTMRVSRPGGYLGSGITLVFPAMLVAAFSSASFSIGLQAIVILSVIRLLVCMVYSRNFVHDRLFPRWLWLVPLRDMLTFFCWALSFLGNQVQWRGSRFMLKPGGKLEELV